MGRVISVLSGKGGVGKTFFVANVAAALSKLNKKTLAIDFDVGLRNLDLALGMQDSTPFDFSDLLGKNVPEANALSTHPSFPMLSFLAGPQFSEFSELPDGCMKPLCDGFRSSFDYILVDCAAGIGRGLSLAAEASDCAVLVTTPETTSVRDCERTAGILRENGVNEIYLVVNRVRPKDIKKGGMINIDDIIDTVNVRLLGLIPEDTATAVRVSRGELAVGNRHAKDQSRTITNIAQRISGVETPLYRFW